MHDGLRASRAQMLLAKDSASGIKAGNTRDPPAVAEDGAVNDIISWTVACHYIEDTRSTG